MKYEPIINTRKLQKGGPMLKCLLGLKITTTIGKYTRPVIGPILHPILAVVDKGLWLADKLGAPSNATNYIRDINIALPYKMGAGVRSIGRKIMNPSKSIEEHYTDALKHPTYLENLTSYEPMTNTADNYSDKELEAMAGMADKKGKITPSSITKYNNRKGGNGKQYGTTKKKMWKYITDPSLIVSTSIGQTNGDPDSNPNTINDTFDFNTTTPLAKRDNAMYMDNFKKTGSLYSLVRALGPKIGSTSEMPDWMKIHSNVNISKYKKR